MKKISLLLCFILCLASFHTVLATDYNIQLSADYYDDRTDALVISGVLPNAIGNVPMSLMVSYSGAVTGAAQTVAVETDGSVSFTFPPVYFSSSAPSGEYTVSVGTLYSDSVVTDTFQYCGADRMYTAMQQVLGVKNGITSFDAVFANYNDALQIDTAAYTSLTTSKESFKTLMSTKTYTLPSGVNSEADSTKVKETVKTFRDDVSEAISICEFMQIQTFAAFEAWVNKYADDYQLDTDVLATQNVDESLIYNSYLLPVMEDQRFLSRISEMPLPENRAALKSRIYEMALLTNIEVKSAVVIKNIFEKFAALFPTTQPQKDAAYSKLATNRYLTYLAAAEAYDIAAQPASVPGVPGVGGGGGGANWGNTANSRPQSITNAIEKNTEAFHDLANAQWATEAITALYEKKIVSGDGSGKFLPQNHITRSEFLKMILLSCGITVDASLESGFSDVSASSWYASYVATAKQLGIIQGGEDGRFLPEANITRQDMIVMLYRAEKHQNSGSFRFADQEAISDYAKDAVSYYAEKGIVSGMGDNRFEPTQLSTRAQAAQLIYNVIR